MILLSWIVAFLSLAYFFARRLKKIDPEEFSFNYWFADNANLLIKSSLAVIIMMIVFTNKETVDKADDFLKHMPEAVQFIPYPLLVAVITGLLNFTVLEFFRRKGKERLEN